MLLLFWSLPVGSALGDDSGLSWTNDPLSGWDSYNYAVSGGGDFNGDGYADFAAGRYYYEEYGSLIGSAFAYYGSPRGVDVSTLDELEASNGYAIGSDVSGAGDVNGDGFDDLIVAGGGFVVLFRGSAAGVGAEQILDPPDADGIFGRVVAGAGDLDGDGYADVVASVDFNAGWEIGYAYVFYGGTAGIEPESAQRLAASDGQESDGFGLSLAGIGDLDGDGLDDLAVGAAGQDDDAGAAYVYAGDGGRELAASEQKVVASDAARWMFFGVSVAGAGDLDHDGYADLAVGALNADVDGVSVGAAYLYLGSAAGVDTGSELRITASDGGAYDDFGRALSGAGDVDGDGFDDIVVGAYSHRHGSNEGAIYVYFGGPEGVDPATETELSPDYCYSFGTSVAGAGDVNGDGLADIVAGAAGEYASGASLFSYCTDGDADGTCLSADCDDADPRFNADALDDDCTDPNDYNCDGTAGSDDADSDLYLGCVDCDDRDGAVNPSQEERCNGVDDNCDDEVDGADSVDLRTWYRDSDGDGYTDPEVHRELCEASDGFVERSEIDDCEDRDASVHPTAHEVPNDGIDQDCDGGDAVWNPRGMDPGLDPPESPKPADMDRETHPPPIAQTSECGCAAAEAPPRTPLALFLGTLVVMRRGRGSRKA